MTDGTGSWITSGNRWQWVLGDRNALLHDPLDDAVLSLQRVHAQVVQWVSGTTDTQRDGVALANLSHGEEEVGCRQKTGGTRDRGEK